MYNLLKLLQFRNRDFSNEMVAVAEAEAVTEARRCLLTVHPNFHSCANEVIDISRQDVNYAGAIFQLL